VEGNLPRQVRKLVLPANNDVRGLYVGLIPHRDSVGVLGDEPGNHQGTVRKPDCVALPCLFGLHHKTDITTLAKGRQCLAPSNEFPVRIKPYPGRGHNTPVRMLMPRTYVHIYYVAAELFAPEMEPTRKRTNPDDLRGWDRALIPRDPVQIGHLPRMPQCYHLRQTRQNMIDPSMGDRWRYGVESPGCPICRRGGGHRMRTGLRTPRRGAYAPYQGAVRC
jgi:hypothetical protein